MPAKKRKADNEQIAEAVPSKKAALGKRGTQAQDRPKTKMSKKKLGNTAKVMGKKTKNKKVAKKVIAPKTKVSKGKHSDKTEVKQKLTKKEKAARKINAPLDRNTAMQAKTVQEGKTLGKVTAKQKNKKAENKKTEKKETGKTKPATRVKSTGSSAGKFSLKDLLKDDKWKSVLKHEFEQPYFQALEESLQAEYADGKEIFPPKDQIFNALYLTPIDKVKVVILGQDPYHDNGQAMGLSFSVPRGIAVPPSLKNIYKELERDPKIEGFKIPDHGCLEDWATEGILMLNATLTVEAHKPNSHAKFGWQTFTDSIIKAVSDHCDHVVFILWGGFAHKKEKLIDTKKHVTIKTAHPSPLSLNKFKNCNCFSNCDDALVTFGLKRINWSLK